MNHLRLMIFYFLIFCTLLNCTGPQIESHDTSKAWSKQKANEWYEKQGWLVGSNFNPSTSINQLEMWQAEDFDTATINKELKWASSIGMNTARGYLHDLLWLQDSISFLQRLDSFLDISKRNDIKVMFVLFDSCWDPFPALGQQRDPKPHVHNSGWVQSPGYDALKDSTYYPGLERYVKGVVSKFSNDNRILAWDIWNEPDNDTGPSYRKVDLPNKVEFVLPLMVDAFDWARSVNPSQPLTSGVWLGDWSTHENMKPIEKEQIELSDIISFHNYDGPDEFEKRIKWLLPYEKPIFCTEYMARPNGSTFGRFLPIAKKYNVAMYNWGLVDGKTQTKYPWDSWEKTYSSEPELWFHEVFRNDGTPYMEAEVKLIRELTCK